MNVEVDVDGEDDSLLLMLLAVLVDTLLGLGLGVVDVVVMAGEAICAAQAARVVVGMSFVLGR